MLVKRVRLPYRVLPLVVIAMGFLAVGCSAVRMYTGPELAPDKIAVLDIGNATVYTFDGIPVSRPNPKRLQILPGEHELRASHNMEGYPEQPIAYTFLAEPGHRYLFGADYEIQRTLSWRPWIKDLADGKIIGGWK